MKSYRRRIWGLALFGVMMAHSPQGSLAQAEGGAVAPENALATAVLELENRWAEIRYDMKASKASKLVAARDFIRDANAIAARFPDDTEPLVWQALALLVEAEIRSDLSAFGIAARARDLLEKAERLDPRATGLIQTSLGMLYYEMPGWPLGFGDKKKAARYLTEALAMDPDGMDSNYFYGDYLLQSGKYREAEVYLERAAKVAVRPGHERADNGRKKDIQEALDAARKAR
jgi:tetratricopeptide (TPR) repeat protein